MPIAIALLCLNTAWAQNRISSPYSRFGIGELFQNTHVNNMAMGGITQGIFSPYFVNMANPASYDAFDTLSFVFDVGLHGRITNLATNTISQRSDYASLGNLLFGFPVTSWWNASFGLLPYSATGYKMSDKRNDPDFGKFSNVYDGSGGINQFYIGSSFALNRKLSVGANVSYLFGTMNHNTSIVFADSTYKLNVKTINSTRAHDFLVNYGIMYHNQKANGFNYNIGLSFNAQTNLNSTVNRLTYNYFSSATGTEVPNDTIINAPSEKRKITLPMGMGLGFSVGKVDKWLLGSDITWKQWEKFSYFGTPDSLQNNLQLSLGGYYNPTSSTVSSYWQRVTYRAGLKYSNGYLKLRDNRINEFGITFGIGLPLPRTTSTINLAAEIGTRGTKEANLISENYVKLTIGLSIFERWFVIRKYD